MFIIPRNNSGMLTKNEAEAWTGVNIGVIFLPISSYLGWAKQA